MHPYTSLSRFITIAAATTIAFLVTRQAASAQSVDVPGSANPWLAGMPDGSSTKGDTAPQQSPVLVPNLSLTAGEALTFAASGATSYAGGSATGTPDGGSMYYSGPANGISGCNYPLDSLVGVFLGPNRPDQNPDGTAATPPPDLSFDGNGSVPGGRQYTELAPALRQVFFIGDGQTDAGVRQRIIVPEGATRLFLASTDGTGWYNNSGTFNVQVGAGPSKPVHGGLSETVFSVNGSTTPESNLVDTVLTFTARQSGRPAGLTLRVQASTTPGVEASWTDLPTGTGGYMTLVEETKQFLLLTKNYPTLNGVHFRCIASAGGYPDSISNVVGPFDLQSSTPRAGSTLFRLIRNGLRADFDFQADVVEQAPGVALRVQRSSNPTVESTWSDLNNGSAGAMTAAGDGIRFSLATQDVAPGSKVYFRAIAAAIGRADSLSNIIGPYTITPVEPPDVVIESPSGNGGVSREAPLIIFANDSGVAAINIRARATAGPGRTIASFSVLVDGAPVFTLPGNGSATAFIDYQKNISAAGSDHVIEAVAFDDLGATARAGSGPRYIRVLPPLEPGATATTGAERRASALTFRREIYVVANSGGNWDDPGTWRDSRGNPGVPTSSDFVIIGDSTVRLNGSGGTIFSLALHGGRIIGPGQLQIGSVITISGGSFESFVTLVIRTGATCDMTNAADVQFDGVLQNQGTLNIHGARGIVDLSTFINTGTVNFRPPLLPDALTAAALPLDARAIAAQLVQDSGRIAVQRLITNDGGSLITNDGGSLITNDGGSLITNDGGSLIGNAGGTLIGNAGGTVISNDGASLITNDGGSLTAANKLITENGAGISKGRTVRAASSSRGYVKSGGETDLTDLAIVGPVALEAGVLRGSGVISGSLTNSGGFIAPGTSPGSITVLGDFAQSGSGALLLEAGGNDAGQFDHLQIGGNASLGGTLVVNTIGGYAPEAADTFNPLAYESVSGAFASISGNTQLTLDANGARAAINAGAGDPAAAKLLNIATRMRVERGENALIAGFIITGAATKKVIVRALGPSIPVEGKLGDPTLELFKPDGSTVFNNDWRENEAEVQATTIPPPDDRESAIVATLEPGSYTAILRGLGDTTGVGLVEVYDLDGAAPETLANISTRGQVQTGDNVMIGGLIIGGDQPAKVLIRAIGPSLEAVGVAGALQDPTLDLVDGQGNIVSNDDWREAQETDIIATTVPPADGREAAIVALLPAGNYTAVVRGKNETTGVALVEAYNLD